MSSKFEPDATIDLHGRRPDAAIEYLRRTVESGRYRGKALEVVHGQGRGVLRDLTREWGERSALVKRMWFGEDVFLPGGGGTTIFFL